MIVSCQKGHEIIILPRYKTFNDSDNMTPGSGNTILFFLIIKLNLYLSSYKTSEFVISTFIIIFFFKLPKNRKPNRGKIFFIQILILIHTSAVFGSSLKLRFYKKYFKILICHNSMINDDIIFNKLVLVAFVSVCMRRRY